MSENINKLWDQFKPNIKFENIIPILDVSTYSLENKPPGLHPKYVKVKYIKISASRKLGVAKPKNPKIVAI